MWSAATWRRFGSGRQDGPGTRSPSKEPFCTDDTQQFWTFPHVTGKRRPDIPVYILISNATGSAAEEFAYNFKHMERGILVGETTVGAAHPAATEIVQGDFEVRLPYGRPINPITGENW